ncbi:MAG: CBS domain-containing protein [Deltaproteobacteria bacterium]|nr:CBS domain-containing protein [Deltaproteobacteria bacterium]
MANFRMPVTEYMTSPVETIDIGQSLVAANALFSEQGVSALGVVNDDGELKGVVSRTDLLHAAVFTQGETFRVPDRPVEEIMKSPALQVLPDADLTEAARLMLKEHVHRIFVTSGDEPVGVVSTRDLMRAVREKRLKTPISEIASGSVVKIRADETIALAVELPSRHLRSGLRARRTPVAPKHRRRKRHERSHFDPARRDGPQPRRRASARNERPAHSDRR